MKKIGLLILGLALGIFAFILTAAILAPLYELTI